MKNITKITLITSLSLLILFGTWLLIKSSNNEVGHIESVGPACHKFYRHQAVRLKNGDVFIFGHTKDKNAAELFHPIDRTFE